ncbi:hypothetical protein [Flavobacterium sp.]|uniref:hypothetical protein n=1 Tax=Flavobacterium sp. TaxID=239 RepID=UPI00374DF0AD
MTKIKHSVLALMVALFATVSCSKESVTDESESAINKSEHLLLKQVYGFENITQNINVSNVEAFKSYNLKKFTNKSTSSEELNYKI